MKSVYNFLTVNVAIIILIIVLLLRSTYKVLKHCLQQHNDDLSELGIEQILVKDQEPPENQSR